MTRRVFTSEHNATDSLHDQRLAAIAAAKEAQIQLVDLNAASLAYVNAIGKEAAQTFNLKSGDMTHLNPHGEMVFARMVADLIIGHPPTIGAGDDWTPSGCLANWFVRNQTLSRDIWRGVLV